MLPDYNMTNRTRSILVGILIMLAYGVLASTLTQNKLIVMIADVISGLAVIGIAVLMFPIFKNYKYSTLTYIFLKFVEGILMIIGGLIFLDADLQHYHDQIYNTFHLYIFIASGFLFYYLLYKTKAVPSFISIWGAMGLFVLLISTLLTLVNINYPILDYFLILIITNEIFLAGWLIIKKLQFNLLTQ
jgi:hypothetical protein